MSSILMPMFSAQSFNHLLAVRLIILTFLPPALASNAFEGIWRFTSESHLGAALLALFQDTTVCQDARPGLLRMFAYYRINSFHFLAANFAMTEHFDDESVTLYNPSREFSVLAELYVSITAQQCYGSCNTCHLHDAILTIDV